MTVSSRDNPVTTKMHIIPFATIDKKITTVFLCRDRIVPTTAYIVSLCFCAFTSKIILNSIDDASHERSFLPAQERQ